MITFPSQMQAYRAHERRTQAHMMQRSSSLPRTSTAPRTSGFTEQARGLRRLFNHSTRSTLRPHASDPTLTPSNSQAPPTSSTSSPSPSRPASAMPQAARPDPLVDPVLRWWDEEDSAEARSQDRAAVEAELERYIAEGLIGTIESGMDLFRYWTVSARAHSH